MASTAEDLAKQKKTGQDMIRQADSLIAQQKTMLDQQIRTLEQQKGEIDRSIADARSQRSKLG